MVGSLLGRWKARRGADEHSRLARALEDYSSAHRDGELRGVNRVAVEKKKIGGSGGKGEKPPQGANLEVLILGEGEKERLILQVIYKHLYQLLASYQPNTH